MKKVISISLFIILLAGTILFVPVKPVLEIKNRKNPSQRFYSASGFKNGFVISYTHSVNKGRVHDYYETTKENTFCLDRTIFVSYGAGIPEPEETAGAVFSVTDNGYEISNLQRYVPELTMAVGLIANHAVTIQNKSAKEYFLTDYFAPQTSLILKITRVSLIDYILHTL